MSISLFRGIADEIDRINTCPVAQHFKVQVRAGRATGFAHQGDCLTFFHLVTDFDEIFQIMRVARRITIAMVDLDHDAVAVAITRPGDNAVSNDRYLGALLTRKIDTGVVGQLARERVCTLAEIR